jgi:hypothetical protein
MSVIARTADGREGAILIDASGAVVVNAGIVASKWSADDAAITGATISNGGLTVAGWPGIWMTTRITNSKTSGKLYIEFLINSYNGYDYFGLAAGSGINLGTPLGNSGVSVGMGPDPYASYGGAGFIGYYNIPDAAATGDVWALAVDFSTSKMWIAKNNVWVNGSDPVAETLPIVSFVGVSEPLFAAIAEGNGSVMTLQSTAASQKYLPPFGFKAWDGGPVTTTSVWSAADAAANSMTLSNGELTVTSTVNGSYLSIRGTTGHSSGKYYVEFFANHVVGGGYDIEGMANSTFNITTHLGSSGSDDSFGVQPTVTWASFYCHPMYNVSQTQATNDVWALAVDFDTGNAWIAQNNVWLGGSNPATGALPIVTWTPANITGGPFCPALTFYQTGESWTLQPTIASQKYAPPAGFKAWDAP